MKIFKIIVLLTVGIITSVNGFAAQTDLPGGQSSIDDSVEEMGNEVPFQPYEQPSGDMQIQSTGTEEKTKKTLGSNVKAATYDGSGGGTCQCLKNDGSVAIENIVPSEGECKRKCAIHGYSKYIFMGGKTYCGTAWTGWRNIPDGVGNPCPPSCPKRGQELDKKYRSVGLFPPRPQDRTKFQCYRDG